MLKINGGYLEGGGQIVRTSVALSVLTGVPIEIYDIRKNRKPPGLKNQHLHAIKFLKDFSNAYVEGLELGSTRLYFKPTTIQGGKYKVDIKTAGSISLLLQAILPAILFSNKITEVFIRGGTDVTFSPSIDYTRFVILPYLKRFVNEIFLDVQRRGFYPRGGGIVYLRVRPKFKRNKYESFIDFLKNLREKVPKYNLTAQEPLEEIYIYSIASEDLSKRNVAERQIEGSREILERYFPDVKIIEVFRYEKTLSAGTVITIVGRRKNGIIFGSDNLGKIGKKAEDVGRECAEKFYREYKLGAIDKHLADNLIPYLGLVGGIIKTSELTGHLLTNIWVVEQFIKERFEVDEENRIVKL